MPKANRSTSRIVTEKDLENNPELIKQGVQVGDEIEISGDEVGASKDALDTIPPSTEEAKPLKEGPAKKITPPRAQKKEFYTVKSRVKHDGNYYEKGHEFGAKDPLVKIFLESDLLE